jgi:uncharacterized membrane protein YgdD (TMEM256/DUF423 family)
MNKMFFNRLMAFASTLGAIGVMVGAFGAHFLKSRLPASDLETIKTGVFYLFIHVLAALFIFSFSQKDPSSRWLRVAGISFITGILLFSGSLFLLGTQSLTGWPVAAIGLATPLGGLCFIMGWAFLLFYAIRTRG